MSIERTESVIDNLIAENLSKMPITGVKEYYKNAAVTLAKSLVDNEPGYQQNQNLEEFKMARLCYKDAVGRKIFQLKDQIDILKSEIDNI